MNQAEREARWRRLLVLIEPIHVRAAATARRLCRSSADGDDLYQESLVRAFEKLHTLRDDAKFGSWFYAVLLSRHRSWFRRWSSHWRSLDEIRGDAEPVGEDGGPWIDRAWRAGRLSRALATLPAVQREAVVLFELDGHSLEEVAAMQGASLAAVKSRLARGRDRLRRHYRKQGWEASAGRTAAEAAAAREAPDREARSGGPGALAFQAVVTAPARAALGEEDSHE
jgi:RNA polymerase sigma-70 factor (ECF subfamily)